MSNLTNQNADTINPIDGTKIDKHGLASELAMIDLESNHVYEDIYDISLNGSMALSEMGESLYKECFRKYVRLIDSFAVIDNCLTNKSNDHA